MKYLGNQQAGASTPEAFELDKATNPNLGIYYGVRFSSREFTSLCPITGQPDFATIFIDYVPDAYIVESKALKLFLYSFRDHRGFHEACAGMIAQKITEAIKPHALRVVALFEPRGGLPIDVMIRLGELSFLPRYCFDVPALPYRGR